MRNEIISEIIKERDNGSHCKSSIDRILAKFRALEKVGYVYVLHNGNTGFVTCHGNKRTQTKRKKSGEKAFHYEEKMMYWSLWHGVQTKTKVRW